MSGNVVVLSGGVGGAKLALGMARITPAEKLTIIVNTGDDFTHLGLRICPDIDTMLYTLGGLANTELGWGRRGESWTFLQTLESLGGDHWFKLGDGDLALHVLRTQALAAGQSLSDFTAKIARRMGIGPAIAPMSDQPVATMVRTDAGEIGFQDYFVRLRCEPVLRGLRFAGAEQAHISPAARAALTDPDLAAIIIAPSNPWLSIDPVLAVPGMRALIKAAPAPVIAVTPIIAGQAVKGPTAKIMHELGISSSPSAVAAHYKDLIDGFLLDSRDQASAGEISVAAKMLDTLMQNLDDRKRVAQAALDLAGDLMGKKT